MSAESFFHLLEILIPFMQNKNKRKWGSTPNGDVTKAICLGMALRYFCGGDPFDIALAHGVQKDEVYKSVWEVVDAVNQSPSLTISFPTNHTQQLMIAHAFQVKSKINLPNCVGAIDCMLIWIETF